MTGRLALAAATLLAAAVLASCAPSPPGDTGAGKPGGAPGNGITFFGDARLGVVYEPDRPGGKSRARAVAE